VPVNKGVADPRPAGRDMPSYSGSRRRLYSSQAFEDTRHDAGGHLDEAQHGPNPHHPLRQPLTRPKDLLEMTRSKLNGEPYDAAAYDARISSSIDELVAKQVDCGVDVINDGEQSKDQLLPAYARDRLAGLEETHPDPRAARQWNKELLAFPDYYKDYYFEPRSKGRVGPDVFMVCTGPIVYTGQAGRRGGHCEHATRHPGSEVRRSLHPATAPRASAVTSTTD